MRTFIALFFSLFSNELLAFNLYFPPDIVTHSSPLSSVCVVVERPKNMEGTELCMLEGPIDNAAVKSGLFEQDSGSWLLSGPGVPRKARMRQVQNVDIMDGTSVCGIEDNFGYHAAGGLCYYALLGYSGQFLSVRSRAISITKKDPLAFKSLEMFVERRLATLLKQANKDTRRRVTQPKD